MKLKRWIRRCVSLALVLLFIATSTVGVDPGVGNVFATTDNSTQVQDSYDTSTETEKEDGDAVDEVVKEKEEDQQQSETTVKDENKNEEEKLDDSDDSKDGDNNKKEDAIVEDEDKKKEVADISNENEADADEADADIDNEITYQKAEFYDRYASDSASSATKSRAMLQSRNNTTVQDVTANIRKRTQWVDESNGDGKITLQYSSNSGVISGMPDMNVVLIQDKSGSMDVNYGYNISRIQRNWGNPAESIYYPIQNSNGWTEDISYLESQGDNYYWNLNHKSSLNGYPGWLSGWIHIGEGKYNTPCQEDGHYYLLIEDDPDSNLNAWTMVHGNNLYNISHTDLHHYEMIDASERYQYLAQDRRVISVSSGYIVNESGARRYISDIGTQYFVDTSTLDRINIGANGWVLNTAPSSQCQDNDRLSKSQEFMTNLAKYVYNANPNTKFAYVPFWGNVPFNGRWTNYSSNASGDGLVVDTEYGDITRPTSYPGVTKINFFQYQNMTSNVLTNQIANDFTYDGTNWSIAFQNTIDFLNGRNAADKEKETLVIFLTDGVPQGASGGGSDIDNPKINGVNEIAQLKSIDGVTVYACGVGVNQLDPSISTRLNNVDSTGRAAYARTTSDFATLYNTILGRINTSFITKVEGYDAFYTDTLSSKFSLDESNLSKDWKVLASPGSGTTKGVPTSVYNAAQDGAKYIYVRSTKTVYWYIGDLTDGSYNTLGHEMSFPIKYADYSVSTGGQDKNVKSNTVQKLTYTSSLSPNSIKTVTMDTPTIIFNRQDKPSITVNKTISGATFDKDTTYRFVYGTKEQSGDKATGYTGAVNVTVKAGQTSGKANIVNVSPGTYYVYEVDNNDNIISSQVGKVTISEKAVITTEAYSSSVPLSAQTSDSSRLNNLDNVLTVTTSGGSVNFTNEYVSVNVSKIWDDGNYDDRPDKVTVDLYRNNSKIDSTELNASNGWKGTFKNLLKYDSDGNLYDYSVKESEIVGYESQINQTGDYSFEITNSILRNSIKLLKVEADGDTPIKGAEFEIKNSKGVVVSTKSSNENGEVVFDNLLPDTYTITETKTTSGHMLLEEPLVVTVPLKFTEKEIVEQGIDKKDCVYYPEADVYLICNLVYEVSNTAIFSLPMTGGVSDLLMYIPLLVGFILLAGSFVWIKRKRIA